MVCSISIKRSALKELLTIDRRTREQLGGHIDSLAHNPFQGSLLKGDLRGLCRLRVGAYRIVFEVRTSELLVLVVRIGNRGRIYRR